jgi:hypothetical protein
MSKAADKVNVINGLWTWGLIYCGAMAVYGAVVGPAMGVVWVMEKVVEEDQKRQLKRLDEQIARNKRRRQAL